MTDKTENKPTFEEAMKHLEAIVRDLQSGQRAAGEVAGAVQGGHRARRLLHRPAGQRRAGGQEARPRRRRHAARGGAGQGMSARLTAALRETAARTDALLDRFLAYPPRQPRGEAVRGLPLFLSWTAASASVPSLPPRCRRARRGPARRVRRRSRADPLRVPHPRRPARDGQRRFPPRQTVQP